MIWLDLPHLTVMRQVVARTVRRGLRREVLWNGNVEPPLWTLLTDRENVMRWAWRTYPEIERKVVEVRCRRPTLPVVRLTDRSAMTRWIDGALRGALDQ